MIEMGEFVGMFIMLFLGFGSGILFKNTPPLVVGCFWGVAVILGSLIGGHFGTTAMNPIFSLVDFGFGKITFSLLVKQIIGQVAGTMCATLILIIISRPSYELKLNNFAAVSNRPSLKKNFLIETLGTLILLTGASIFSLVFGSSLIKTLLVGLLITVLITVIGPITGASFNPIRDFIPRVLFSWVSGDFKLVEDQNKSVISSNLAPLLAGGIFIFIGQGFSF